MIGSKATYSFLSSLEVNKVVSQAKAKSSKSSVVIGRCFRSLAKEAH